MKIKKNKKRILYKVRKHRRHKSRKFFNDSRLQPRVTVTYVVNNILFNISCRLWKKPNLFSTVYWVSCGSLKFTKLQYKGSTKTTYVSNFAFGNFLSKCLQVLKFRSLVTLVIKGFGGFFKAFIKGFKRVYKKRFNILDLTPISLNGCRMAKFRRV